MIRTGMLFLRGLKLTLILTALLCLLPDAVTYAQTQGQAVITNSYANIRSGPGTGYKRLGRALEGERFPVTGTRAEWYRILYKGREAWVFARLARIEQSGPSAAEVQHLETQIADLNQRVDKVTGKLENVRQTLEAGIAEARLPDMEPQSPLKKNKKEKVDVPRELRQVGAAWAFIPGASRMRQGQPVRGSLMFGLTAGCAAAGAWAWNSYNSLREDYRAIPTASPQDEFDRALSRAERRRDLAVGLLAGAAGLYAFNMVDHFLFLPQPNLALAPSGDGERVNLSLSCEF